jgi:type I restriction enzyme S subunit
MTSVKHKRLGDLLNLKRGYDLTEAERVPGPYPVVSSSGVSGYHNDFKVQGPGVVIGRYGTLGEAHYLEERYWPHNTSLYVTDFKGNLPRYIYYLLTCLGRIKTSDKSAVPGVNRNELHEMAVPAITDLDAQTDIAEVLRTLDAKIHLNNQINHELESMAKLLYDYWFVQFDFPMTAAQAAAMGKPKLAGHPYRASGGKMVYNETLKRDIPEGWQVVSLISELSVMYGYPFSTDFFNEDGIGKPVVRIRDILNNSTSCFSTENVSEKYLLQKEDLVIGMDGNFHINFWAKEGCWLNQRCLRIRRHSTSSISIFQTFFDIKPHIKSREKNVSRTTVGHLSAKDIEALNVLCPDKSSAFNHVSVFDTFLKQVLHNRNENQELSQLRDWLLPMLMNGQIKVG